jgi:uncharacterized protein YndB with AHSA1/START domain
MTDDRRAIHAEIEVPGTPEQVWEAIATGPGISSWYVPHTVEERTDGAMVASFGPGMDAPGRVAAWEPPERVVFDGGDASSGLAFEWLVEARDGGTCVVRLVNSGFGSGEDWDDQYDAMESGWALFLFNLRLHLEHFAGQRAAALLPMASWPVDQDHAWAALTEGLGIDPRPVVGESIAIELAGDLGLTGTVAKATEHSISVLLTEPAAGTGFIAAEAAGGDSSVSIWTYLYGENRAALAERDAPQWAAWLSVNAPS